MGAFRRNGSKLFLGKHQAESVGSVEATAWIFSPQQLADASLAPRSCGLCCSDLCDHISYSYIAR